MCIHRYTCMCICIQHNQLEPMQACMHIHIKHTHSMHTKAYRQAFMHTYIQNVLAPVAGMFLGVDSVPFINEKDTYISFLPLAHIYECNSQVHTHIRTYIHMYACFFCFKAAVFCAIQIAGV